MPNPVRGRAVETIPAGGRRGSPGVPSKRKSDAGLKSMEISNK